MRMEFGGGIALVEIVGVLVMLAFWVLVLVALVLGIRWLVRADRRGQSTETPVKLDPLEVLRHRYANGEIDEEEFERRRRTLTGT